MVGIRDFFDAFKPAFKSGRTDPGTWRNLEKFGRFEGAGEVRAELDLPEGDVVISIEELRDHQGLELELVGPSGEPLGLERHSRDPDNSAGAHNLYRMASAAVSDSGLHQLRVTAPDSEQPLWIVVGGEAGVTDVFG